MNKKLKQIKFYTGDNHEKYKVDAISNSRIYTKKIINYLLELYYIIL